jgi:hypothetical protein
MRVDSQRPRLYAEGNSLILEILSAALLFLGLMVSLGLLFSLVGLGITRWLALISLGFAAWSAEAYRRRLKAGRRIPEISPVGPNRFRIALIAVLLGFLVYALVLVLREAVDQAETAAAA